MKKIISLLLVTAFAIPLLTACGGGILGRNSGISDNDISILSGLLEDLSNAADGITTTTDSGSSSSSGSGATQSGNSQTNDGFEYGNGRDFIAKNLTGDYSIKYTVYANGSDETAEVFTIRTSEGYCIGTFGSTALYIKNSDNLYETYFSSNDGFYKVDFLDPITEDEVKSNMEIIFGFMTQYSGTSGLQKGGTETIVGRNCDIYKESVAGFGVAMGISFWIDKETGVCLKFTYDMAAEGGMANMSFECTEFRTSGVKLPDYK